MTSNALGAWYESPDEGDVYNYSDVYFEIHVFDLGPATKVYVDGVEINLSDVHSVLGHYVISGNWALNDGFHSTYANDTILGTEYSTDTIHFLVDANAPNVTINTESIIYNQNTDIINVSVSDVTNVTVTAEIDGSKNVTLTKVGDYYVDSTYTFSEGTHNVRIYAIDALTHINSTETVNFTVDTTNPLVTINTESIIYNQNTDIINVSVSDVTNVTVTAEIDGSKNVTLTKVGDYYVDSTYTFSEGTHNVRIYAIDSATNKNSTETVKFIVDQSKPELNVTVPGSTNSTTIPISINVSEPANTTINVYDENGTLIQNVTVSGNATVNVTVPGEGTYTVNVTTTDDAGNSVSNTTHVTVDQSKPELNVTVPGSTNSTTIPISINVSEPANTTINVYDENGTLIQNVTVSGNATVNVTVPGEGTYTVNVTTTDDAGNSVSNTTHVTVDQSKPELNVTVPGSTNSTTIPISINVSEPANTTINVYDENGTLIQNVTVSGNATVNVTVPGEGTYTVNVTTTDDAGNSVSNTTHVTVDQSKPELNVTVPGSTNSTTIPISINVSEPANTTINVYDENGTLIQNVTVSGNATVNVTVPGEGTYTVNVTTTDDAGNSVSNTTHVTVDQSKPELNVTVPGSTNSTTIPISINVSEPANTTINVYDENGTLIQNVTVSGNATVNVTVPGEGTYTVNVTTTDDAGNSVSNTTHVTVDQSKPELNVTVPGSTNSTTIPISINVSEPANTTINVYDENGTLIQNVTVSGNATVNVTVPGEGTYTVNVTTTDDAGNSVSNTTHVTVDQSKPELNVTVPGSTNSTTIPISINVSEPANTTINVYDENGTLIQNVTVSGNATVNVTVPGEGTYTVNVTTTDDAGNSVSNTTHVTVDQSKPELNVTVPGSTNSTTIPISINVSEPANTTINVYDENGTLIQNVTVSGNATVNVTVPGEGTYTVNVTTTDDAGNSVSNTTHVTVDQSKPELNVTVPGSTNSTTIPISINVSEPANTTINVYDENGTLIQNVTVSGNATVNVTVPGEGTYTVNVTTTDDAGNSVSNTTHVTVDQSKPELNVTVPGSTNSTTIPISINVSEPANTTINVYDENGTLIQNVTVSGNATVNVTVPGEGTYTVNVTTTDDAGNSVSNTTHVTVDQSKPELNVTVPGSTNSTTIPISINVSEPANTTINVYDENGTLIQNVTVSGNATVNVTVPGEGTYTVNVTTTDDAGNSVSNTTHVTVDQSKPELNVTVPGSTNSTTIPISINVSEPANTTINVYDENGTLIQNVTVSGNATVNVTVPGEGTYTVNVTTTDDAGNSVSNTTHVTVENLPDDSGTSGSSTRSHSSGGGGGSLSGSNFFSSYVVIYGNEIDYSCCQYLAGINAYNDSGEYTGNIIIIGGPNANKYAEKYNEQFEIPISNEIPGENTGVIQVLKLQDNSGIVLKTTTILYLAGSDRYGTQAAVDYAKNMTELPESPIKVKWTESGPKVVE
ncbi:beta strand repeat-containing protein [Methanococcus sp. CF]